MAWISRANARRAWAGLLLIGVTACGSSNSGLLEGGDGGPDGAAGTGGAAGSGGAAGAGGTAPVPCKNSLDCVASNGVCDPASQTCVECLANADCVGQICDTTVKRCVECLHNADCALDQACIGGKCATKTACQSDNTCKPLGKLCDKQLGYCVDCVQDTDCPDADFCSGGVCQPDVCAPGQGSCTGNSRTVCNAAGSGFDPTQPCPAQTTCVASGGAATCTAWKCQAGQTYCESDTTIVCSADGLTIQASQDCTVSGRHCVAGQCTTQLCNPSTTYCKNGNVMMCNATGTSESVLTACTAGQYCDTATASCQVQLCTPNQPACNGTLATTCNSTGSGYAAGGTDCSLSGKSCDSGVCSTCPGGNGAVDQVRIAEVHIYADYIMLENRSANCSANLAGLSLYGASTIAAPSDFTVTFTSQTLAPGAKVAIIDSAANAGPTQQASDVVSTMNIPYDSAYGGMVLLCTGSTCSATSSTNVIDMWAMTSDTAVAPPPWSSSLTFSPAPLAAIPSANEIAQSYFRTAYAGHYPAFLASDWTVGSATRPE